MILSHKEKHILRATATACIGIPYKYGAEVKLNMGIEPKDIEFIDCSEIIQYLFFKALRIIVPDGSYNQYDASLAVDEEMGQCGDMVFKRNKFTKRIGHVALYIGDWQVIEANGFQGKVIQRGLDSFQRESKSNEYAGMRSFIDTRVNYI